MIKHPRYGTAQTDIVTRVRRNQSSTDKATLQDPDWQTTYAVLKLPEIIKQAKPFDQNYRCTEIKEGSQTKNRYVELIKLRYTFNSKKLDYMNFTIEMVIGKKRDGKHVQYSLEHIKKACS